MFFISSGLEVLSVNHNVNSESNVFKNIEYFGEISNHWQNYHEKLMHTRLLNFVDIYYWQ